MMLSRGHQRKRTLERRDGNVFVLARLSRLQLDIDADAVGELDAVHNYAARESPVGDASAPGENSGTPRQLQRIRPQHDERGLDVRRRAVRAGDVEIARHAADGHRGGVALVERGHDSPPSDEGVHFARDWSVVQLLGCSDLKKLALFQQYDA